MSIRLSRLLENLPTDTEDRVKQAKERWNKPIREALRRETRLSLHRRGEYTIKDEVIAVPIAICPGLPTELKALDDQIADGHELALLLAPYRQIITALGNSSESVIQELLPFLRLSKLSAVLAPGIESEIAGVRHFSKFLLARLKSFDLSQFILSIDQDVLGVYRYKTNRFSDDPQPKIELYWAVIGLIARDLSLEPEHLTCVVLAHELAHAYTHIGSDADDQYWVTSGFHNSSRDVVEGLAQYYGWLVSKRLDASLPGVLDAYCYLLEKQSGPYRVHEAWTADFTAEHIRSAMLHVRRDRPAADLEFFTDALKTAKAHLPKASRVHAAMGEI